MSAPAPKRRSGPPPTASCVESWRAPPHPIGLRSRSPAPWFPLLGHGDRCGGGSDGCSDDRDGDRMVGSVATSTSCGSQRLAEKRLVIGSYTAHTADPVPRRTVAAYAGASGQADLYGFDRPPGSAGTSSGSSIRPLNLHLGGRINCLILQTDHVTTQRPISCCRRHDLVLHPRARSRVARISSYCQRREASWDSQTSSTLRPPIRGSSGFRGVSHVRPPRSSRGL